MNQKGPVERRSDGSSGYTDGSTAEGVSTERDPQADDVDGTTDDRTTDGSDDTEKTDGSDDTEKMDGSDDTEKTGGVDDPGTPEKAGVEPIPTDEVFALLSNGRRRHVLRFLSENGGEIKLRELATTIAAEENDLDPVEVTYTQRKRLYTSLYQSHLPRMERSGVIEYNRNSGLVSYPRLKSWACVRSDQPHRDNLLVGVPRPQFERGGACLALESSVPDVRAD